MDIDQKFNQIIWWVLQEIKKERRAASEDEYVYFKYQSHNESISFDDKRRAIKFLENKGAIKIMKKKHPPTGYSDMAAEAFGINPLGVLLDIIKPKFDEIYNQFSELPEIKIADLQKVPIKNIKQNALPILYLNSIGDLWREPKNKYCYQMSESSKRHGLVRYLAEHNGYQGTPDIAMNLNIQNEDTLRKEIRKINENFQGFLHIKRDKLIISKRGSGYRINPQYKIIVKK